MDIVISLIINGHINTLGPMSQSVDRELQHSNVARCVNDTDYRDIHLIISIPVNWYTDIVSSY